MKTQKILVVDDNPGYFPVVMQVCAEAPELEVIGYASSGSEALLKAAELRPDLILMDLDMPGMSGLETTRRLKGIGEKAGVIIITLHNGPEYEQAARNAGALSLVTKSDMGTSLLPTIRKVSLASHR